MCDRDPLPWWTQGRVTLLGDAAHPMYPVGSNGASQAILDARCLTDLLATHPVPEALAAYEANRLPATAAVVASNRVGGPERVIDLVADRRADGFARIEDVATEAELAGICGATHNWRGSALKGEAMRDRMRRPSSPPRYALDHAGALGKLTAGLFINLVYQCPTRTPSARHSARCPTRPVGGDPGAPHPGRDLGD